MKNSFVVYDNDNQKHSNTDIAQESFEIVFEFCEHLKLTYSMKEENK